MVRLVLATLIALICAPTPQENQNQSSPPASDQPTSQPATRTKPRNPQQARIYEALLRDTAQERVPLIVSQTPGEEDDEGQPAAEASARLLPEGVVLRERAGRLVRTGDRSEFHFKSGDPATGAQETMELNKNGWLEMMETESEAGVKEFVITAEVTVYRGRNYLNLLNFRRRPSHGNLTP